MLGNIKNGREISTEFMELSRLLTLSLTQIIIPNYKEPIGKLRQTLDTIASQVERGWEGERGRGRECVRDREREGGRQGGRPRER